MGNHIAKDLPRQTFSIVVDNQDSLRNLLQELAVEGRTVEDGEEDTIRQLVSRSCLGLEKDYDVVIKAKGFAQTKSPGDEMKDGEKFVVFEGNISQLINFVLNFDEDEKHFVSDVIPYWAEEPLEATVGVERFWAGLLNSLEEDVWPEARNMSLRVTPERDNRDGSTTWSPEG